MLYLLILLHLAGPKPVPKKPVPERALFAFKKQAEKPLRNYLPNFFFAEDRLTETQCWTKPFKPQRKGEKWTFKLLVSDKGFTIAGNYVPQKHTKPGTQWPVKQIVTWPGSNRPLIADADGDGIKDAIFWLRPVINKATSDLVVLMAGQPDSSFRFKYIQSLGSMLHSTLELGGYRARFINNQLILDGPASNWNSNGFTAEYNNLVYAEQYFVYDKGRFKHDKTRLVERGLKKYFWFEDQATFWSEPPEPYALEKAQRERIKDFMAKIGAKYK